MITKNILTRVGFGSQKDEDEGDRQLKNEIINHVHSLPEKADTIEVHTFNLYGRMGFKVVTGNRVPHKVIQKKVCFSMKILTLHIKLILFLH